MGQFRQLLSMFFKKSTCLWASLLCLSGIVSCSATDDFFSDRSNDLRKSHWEFGIQTGYAMPIGNKSRSIQASNAVFLISDPPFPGEDEFAENGLATPDFNAFSTIQGDVQNTFYAGAHLYYRITPWIATGMEGSLSVQRAVLITQS